MSLYDTLGIKKGASKKEIRDAYRKKARENHPDKGGKNEDMVLINKAHYVLSDPSRKAIYDETGETEMKSFNVRKDHELCNIFTQAISTIKDFDHEDIITKMLEVLRQNVRSIEDGLKACDKNLNKLKKIRSRLSYKSKSKEQNPLIINLLESNINSMEGAIKKNKADIEFLNSCRPYIEEYTYKTDPAPIETVKVSPFANLQFGASTIDEILSRGRYM